MSDSCSNEARAHMDNASPVLRRCWHPVCRVEDLAGMRRVSLLGEGWVVVRDDDGEVRAYLDVCPHRRAPLSAGTLVDGALRCPYHGWEFATADGACALIPSLGRGAAVPPAARLVPAAAVVEHLGLVWLAPEPPMVPLPQFPEWHDPRFATANLRPTRVRVGCAPFADNFVDVSHFPFVHGGSFGSAAPEDTVGLDPVEVDGWLLHTRYSAGYRAPTLVGGPAGGPQATSQARTVTAPWGLHMTMKLETGATNAIFYGLCPEDPDHTTIFKLVAYDDVGEGSLGAVVDFEVQVLQEDLVELERLPDQRIALDPRADVHVRADRPSLALRRQWAALAGSP